MAALVIVLLLAAATIPVWLPWVLRPLAQRFGVAFGAYERRGYAGFVVHDVRARTPTLEVTANRGEINAVERRVTVRDWRVATRRAAQRPKPSRPAPDSTTAVLDVVTREWARWRTRLRSAELTAGTANINGNEFAVPQITWQDGVLRGKVTAEKLGQTFTIVARPDEVQVLTMPAAVAVHLGATRHPDGWQVAGRARWEGNLADFSARFADDGWLPVTARISADRFRYRDVEGMLAAHWDGAKYTAQLAATSAGQMPFQAAVSVRGDLNGALFEKFLVTSPGVEAALTEDVRLNLQHPYLSDPAKLRVRVDLAKLPGSNAAGIVNTEAMISSPTSVRLSASSTAVRFGTMRLVDLQLDGEYEDGAHSGRLSVAELDMPALKPLRIAAAWRGRGRESVHTAATVAAGESELLLEGDADVRAGVTVELSTLTLRRADAIEFALAEPCRVSATGGVVRVESFRWTGPGNLVALTGAAQWPQRGRWRGEWRSVNGAAFADFLRKPIENVWLTQLDFRTAWDNGPAKIELTASGQLSPPGGERLAVQTRVATSGEVMRVDAAVNSESVGGVLVLEGSVPVTLAPSRWPAALHVSATQPFQLTVRTLPNPAFWREVSGWGGVRLQEPVVTLDLRGPLTSPVGELSARAAAVELPAPKNAPVPRLEQLNAEARIDERGLRLEQLRLMVERQPVLLSAELPMDRAMWTDLAEHGQWPDWQRARGHVRIVNARLAPFARFWSAVLAPQGMLDVDLALETGARLNGTVLLADAATRPLAPVGPIDQMRARLRFRERRADLEEFSGRLAGQPVTLTGAVHLPSRTQAQAEFHLVGKNVPLVRQPGLLFRADVNAWFRQGPDHPATLSGELVLRDSLFLRELRLLAPTKLEAVQRRPPYFRVEAPPFADWRLAVRLHGDRFLQVRSPVFRGEISAAFDLTGTFAEPLAVGSVQINSGLIRFPFTDFRVEQGLITLSSEDPYHPRLSVNASARSFGYDLKLALAGTANEPQMTFSATPPLSSEEVLLMVTAGQLPRQEYTFTASEKASRLALFVGRDLLRQFGGGESGLAERLTIRSGEDVSEQGTLTYYLEYRLTNHLSAVAEQDRFGEYNVGLKWRVFSR